MRSALLASVLGLALAPTAHAGGINLAWNDCGAFGASSQTFACNTNTGARKLYVSFVPPSDLSQFNGTDGIIDIASNQPTLGQWWNLANTGNPGCRNSGFDSADFTAGPFSCLDPWVGSAVSARNYQYLYQGIPYRARLHFVTAVVSAVTVTVDHEYYDFSFLINNNNSTGAGACGGCLDGVCIVLQSLNLTQTQGNPSVLITNPLLSQSVTWQTGAPVCPGATPSRNSTWGSVKALYR